MTMRRKQIAILAVAAAVICLGVALLMILMRTPNHGVVFEVWDIGDDGALVHLTDGLSSHIAVGDRVFWGTSRIVNREREFSPRNFPLGRVSDVSEDTGTITVDFVGRDMGYPPLWSLTSRTQLHRGVRPRGITAYMRQAGEDGKHMLRIDMASYWPVEHEVTSIDMIEINGEEIFVFCAGLHTIDRSGQRVDIRPRR